MGAVCCSRRASKQNPEETKPLKTTTKRASTASPPPGIDYVSESQKVIASYRETKYSWTTKILGKGEVTNVYLARDRATSKQVAIKRVAPNLLDLKRLLQINREAKILNKISKIPNTSQKFVKFVEGFVDHQGGLCIVTNLIPGCELYHLLIQYPNGMPEEMVRRCMRNVLEAVHMLHSNEIAHLDIKLENIVYDKTSDILKLIDFGFAVPTSKIDLDTGIEHEVLVENYCGSYEYVAPEILLKQPYNGKKADIWSMGVLCYTMLCGKFPFAAKRFEDLSQKISAGVYDPPSKVSLEVLSFLQQTICVNYSQRPTTGELLEHPWFSSL